MMASNKEPEPNEDGSAVARQECSLRRRNAGFYAAPACRNGEEEDGGDGDKKCWCCNLDVENACVGSYGWKRRHLLFPPPLPVLARTGELRCYMPWRLTRFYPEDGRLVIKAVRSKRHDHFRATRREGRLTLTLVSADERALAMARWSPQREGGEREKTAKEEMSEEVMSRLERIAIETVAEKKNAALGDDALRSCLLSSSAQLVPPSSTLQSRLAFPELYDAFMAKTTSPMYL